MDDSEFKSAIEADLAMTPGRTVATRPPRISHTDIVAVSNDIQLRADGLLNNSSVPQTLVGKVLDAFIPDPVRGAKRKRDETLVLQETGAEVQIHKAMKGAQVRHFVALADAHGRACEVRAEEEVGARALESLARVKAEILRHGAASDRELEKQVEDSATLKTETARTARANRLLRCVELGTDVEEAIVNRIRDAVRGARRPT